MKKLYILSFALISSLSFAQISTSFSGTGALNANGWTTHSGTIPGQLTLSTGSLSYTGLTTSANRATLVAGNTEDVNKASTAPLTGVVYYSAVLNVINTTGLNLNTANGDYFLSAATTSGTTGVTGLPARLYVRSGATADTFNIGLLNNSGGTVTPTYVATDFPVNASIFVVVKYDTAGNTSSLFVNPVIGSTEGTPTVTNATGTNTAAQIAAMAIRQGGNATAGTGNVEIDELRLNTTWADVTSAALKVNQNAIAGLSIFPNPVKNGVFYINTDANAERTITVFDVLGKQVLNTTTSESAINVSNLTSGVYMVQISEEGNTATKKLVIE
ncbi:T9SS type A sorting domain-containing protein [Flavobacterium chungnamense]|uniref:T9SS type A sorting domain-containing protein n=1 Tax=Flavobacterium chungnamense TaxID=706182 RepID=A0ABP7UMA1_9FLAO